MQTFDQIRRMWRFVVIVVFVVVPLSMWLTFGVLTSLQSLAYAAAPVCTCSPNEIPVCVAAPLPTATPTRAPTATRTPTRAPTVVPTAPTSSLLVEDDFSGADGVITDSSYYANAQFPNGGTSAPTNPSQIWEGDSGQFLRQNSWGYSGRPIDWGDRWFFRFNTRSFAIGDASVSWTYRSAPFGQDGYTVEGADAVDVWLRYQTQYNLYTLQFDRTNNCIVAKRKLPAEGWGGPASLVSNKGVYYTLKTDAAQPIFGAGQQCISWEGVRNLLPASEQSKPKFPNLAHDSTTPYDFAATVTNVAGGKVQIQLSRAGKLVFSAIDDGRSGTAADGTTQGTHLDRGYFNSVKGWQATWGLPIAAPGASGFRADNIKFWIDNFRAVSK